MNTLVWLASTPAPLWFKMLCAGTCTTVVFIVWWKEA